MKKITYMVGAGASYHSLPLLASMEERMRIFREFIYYRQAEGKMKQDPTDFLKELDHLLFEISESTSIDAYAEELYKSSNKIRELNRLKLILSGYLIWEQLTKDGEDNIYSDFSSKTKVNTNIEESIRMTIDKRYRTLWNRIISDTAGNPRPNVKVISWNYDMQFEFAYARPRQEEIKWVQEKLQIHPAVRFPVDLNRFCLLKLNGTAGLFRNGNQEFLSTSFDLVRDTLDDFNLDILIGTYNKNESRVFEIPIFSFAWESSPVLLETRRLAKEIIKDTDILVLIGYSFPDTNWDIDREIFRDSNQVSQVHLQVDSSNAKEILQRFRGINSDLADKTEIQANLSTFFIPNEL